MDFGKKKSDDEGAPGPQKGRLGAASPPKAGRKPGETRREAHEEWLPAAG